MGVAAVLLLVTVGAVLAGMRPSTHAASCTGATLRRKRARAECAEEVPGPVAHTARPVAALNGRSAAGGASNRRCWC